MFRFFFSNSASHSSKLQAPSSKLQVRMQGLLTVLSLVAAVAHAAPAAPPLSQYATKSYTLSGDLYAPTPGAILGNDPSEALPTTSTDPTHFDTAPGQDTDTPSGASYDLTNLNNPQPFRGTRGGTAAFNRDEDLEKLFPNSLIPPTTDHGSVDQASWPMGKFIYIYIYNL